ncbi:Transcription initiation protein spt3 [Diplodia intermedia]|uniref:Transcription initiation protein spt3 n=1 Tax=Diplodia intermedia TaxID=856260 RepID=A0ABR3TMY5_9PEZI
MMFVAGEAGDISPETTSVVEHIVQQQVIELLSRADALASRRGGSSGGSSGRLISTDDLIFLVRDDPDKVSRLLHFLAWKELRKSARDRDDDNTAIDAVDADVAPTLPPEDTSSSSSSSRTKTKAAAAAAVLPWDITNLYASRPPPVAGDHDQGEGEKDQQESSDLRRLQRADERTQGMTRQEYAVWSEARQASFTRRKKAKFRAWAGLGVVLGEDVVDVLGRLSR